MAGSMKSDKLGKRPSSVGSVKMGSGSAKGTGTATGKAGSASRRGCAFSISSGSGFKKSK